MPGSRFGSNYSPLFMFSSAVKMDRKRKEMSTDHKKMIVKLSNENVSGSKLAELLGSNRFTIAKFLKRFKTTGMIEKRHRTGRPRKTDDRADRRLKMRVVKNHRRKYITFIFNAHTPTKISQETVERRLKFHGYKRRIVKKKIVISRKNRRTRRAWCRSKLHLTVDNYWRKIIFSDETQVVFGKDRKVYIWRREREKWAPRCHGMHADPDPILNTSVVLGVYQIQWCWNSGPCK